MCITFHPSSLNYFIHLENMITKIIKQMTCDVTITVVTPLWARCEGEAHTPKSGNLESSGTPENSEFELKDQNTSHWGVLGVIGKVLKCRCLNWQFDSRPQKVGNRPLPDVCNGSTTRR